MSNLKLFLIIILFFLVFSPVSAVMQKIDYGVTMPGSITTPGSVDTYTFSGQKGDTTVIRIIHTGGGNIWPQITLYGPLGNEIKRVNGPSNAEITTNLTASGSYKILVDDGFNGKYIGDYSLFVQRVNNPGNIKAIEPGTALPGSIGKAGVVDTYTVSARNGDVIDIRITHTGGGNIWPRITLYRPSGTEIKRVNGPSNAEITSNLTETGTYTILVDDGFSGSYIGDYSLFVMQTSSSGADDTTSRGAPTLALTTSSNTASGTVSTAGTEPTIRNESIMGQDPLGNYILLFVGAIIIAGAGFILYKRQAGKQQPAGYAEYNSGIPPPLSQTTTVSGTVNHEIIISYSTHDKPIADAVCAGLEARGIRCWIAPRDILPGVNYQEGIIDAITSSIIMVLIYSHHANESPHVIREATIAMSKKVIIIPFRVENAPLSKTMEFIISVPHWLDAVTPPLEKHIKELGDTIMILLENERKKRNTD